MRLPTSLVPSLPTSSRILSYTLITMTWSPWRLSTLNFRQVERQPSATLTWGSSMLLWQKNLNYPSLKSFAMRSCSFSRIKIRALSSNEGMNDPAKSSVVSSFVILKLSAGSSSIWRALRQKSVTAFLTLLKIVTVFEFSAFVKLVRVSQSEVCFPSLLTVMRLTVTSSTVWWMWKRKLGMSLVITST